MARLTAGLNPQLKCVWLPEAIDTLSPEEWKKIVGFGKPSCQMANLLGPVLDAGEIVTLPPAQSPGASPSMPMPRRGLRY